ncbi:MAG: translocation/assembly module TamB domain-containing protein [Calothrix sp. C42_A2020_038]|nr:translocation/assembly module TamB domain-containing protein [Calothrix sp. C42_A2020_038]
MTNPNCDSTPQPIKARRFWLMLLSRSGIAVSGLLVVGLALGCWRLWKFVKKDLTPIASRSITEAINRPVQLGAVQAFSLGSVKFGASTIPATPNDPDNAKIESVDVSFDLLQLLLARRLKLDVTLVSPSLYIQQDNQGRWITTTIQPPSKNAPFKTDLDKIRFRNGNLVLAPRHTKSQLSFSNVNGVAQLLENNQLVKYEAAGKPTNGGSIFVRGETRPRTIEHKLNLQVEDLLAKDVTTLVKLPVKLQAGQVKKADLRIEAEPEQPPLLFGSAIVNEVKCKVANLPQPFVNTNGLLSFDKTQVKLENLTGSYSKIPLLGNGTIDRISGFNLAARVDGVSAANVQETLKIKLPVPVVADLNADLLVTGEIDRPVLSGRVSTIKNAKIDKVDFNNVTTKFEFLPRSQQITFSDIQGTGTLGGVLTGTGVVKIGQNPEVNFNVTAQNIPGDAIAQIYNINPDFQIGTIAATAQLTGAPENVQTKVQWQSPNGTYPGTGETTVYSDRSVTFRNVNLNVAGGKVQAAGRWANQQWQVAADTSGIPVEQFVNKEQLENVNIEGVKFDGRLLASGTTAPFKIASVQSENAGISLGDGRVAIKQVQFNEQNFAAQLVASNVRLSRVLKESAPILQNPLAGTFQIAGNRDNITLKTIQGTGNAVLNVGGGTVGVNNIQLQDGAYQAQLQINNSNVQELAQVPSVVQGLVTGNFQVAGTVDSFQLQAIRARGTGRLNVDGGSFNAENILLDKGRYQAQVQANNVRLQRYAKIPSQVESGLNGLFNVTGTVDSFQPENIQLSGTGKLKYAGGEVIASNIRLDQGRYQAVVNASGVKLKRINPQLQGLLVGNLQVAGAVNNFGLANLAAVGKVGLSQGVGGIEQPLTADIGWNGTRLTVQRATSRDVTATGYITVNAKNTDVPEITDLNLDVIANNYNLQNLPAKLPSPITLAGKADFAGKITGRLPIPNVTGQVVLRDLNINQFAFDTLKGSFTTERGSGLKLDVNGKDRIALTLDALNRPKEFNIRWRQATATGQAQGENLKVEVNNFPLLALNLTPPSNGLIGQGSVSGTLAGNLLVNPSTFTANGDIAVKEPQVGTIKGNSLNATFAYNNGTLTLQNSSFNKNNSVYSFAGTVIPTSSTPKIQGQLTVAQGNIQDVLTTLQIFELQDFQRGFSEPRYGNAANLSGTRALGVQGQPVLTQIKRLSEIQALVDNQQTVRRDASPLPQLADLAGTFNGEVRFDTASPNGLTADFKIKGENFVFGRQDDPDRYFGAEKIIVQGSFNEDILRLQPLRVESENRLFTFVGTIGSKEQSGQLQVTNFPVQILSNFVKLPVGLTGNLSGQAVIAGNIFNPQAKGDFAIREGTLNAKGVQSANTSFSYSDGRLNFNSQVNVGNSDPVIIKGGIPYQFPIAISPPTSDQIDVDVKVKNKGLAVINLFTNQVKYEDGEGGIDLKVQGTRDQLILNGTANLNKATFSAQAIPGNITDVLGKIKFDFDRVIVNNLQGTFSQGKVTAVGEIPISDQELLVENPLTLTLERIALNLKSLYQGGASGNLKLTGSTLSPLIGGNIELNNGKVLLSESSNLSPQPNNNLDNKLDKNLNDLTTLLKNTKLSETESNENLTRFDDLQIKLGKNVRITRAPILDFTATGDLSVTGSINDPVPQGVIKLKDGGVNLFTTRFNLVRGYEHTATFKTSQPRDPELDIQLFAKVLDVVQSSDFSRSTTGLAALESVRVEAIIQGLASQLNENLELTSTPSRSQNELVALLGGGFVDTQGRGNDSTLGLVNIAGSAVFNNFQNAFNEIGTAFGLSEFRLFPTIISQNPEAGRSVSSLELAAEAGVDISPKVSASALKILTARDPVQWGLNYRINKEIRFRASTNLFNDNRAVVEFERRF